MEHMLFTMIITKADFNFKFFVIFKTSPLIQTEADKNRLHISSQQLSILAAEITAVVG